MKDKSLREMLTEMTLHSLGIVPYTYYREPGEINKKLASIPESEARRMKRKFRKHWRRIAKKLKPSTQARIGLGESSPTITQKNRRKFYVYEEARRKFVDPIIDKNNAEIL